MVRKAYFYYANLIVGNKKWFFVIVTIFSLSAFIGVLISLFETKTAEQIIAGYARSIDRNLNEGWATAWYIYQRNILVSVLASFFSFFLGLAAVFVTIVNGVLLGLVFGYPKIYTEANPLYVALLVVPHGIFEYFATFLSLSFGLRLGINWILPDNRGKRFKTFAKNFLELLTVLFLAGIILFIAALIEGFVTKNLADCLFGKCNLNF